MKNLTLAALLAVAPFAAAADELSLTSPEAGGVIHTDAAEMSVYWTPEGDMMEVVAAYIPRDGGEVVRDLRMQLNDGDTVTFGLPGIEDAVYRFARKAGTLTVTPERDAEIIELAMY